VMLVAMRWLQQCCTLWCIISRNKKTPLSKWLMLVIILLFTVKCFCIVAIILRS